MLDQAVILCGGLGTRLGKLTETTPKPMLPVNGRPFIDILIQEISRFGVGQVLLVAGKFGNQIFDRFNGTTINHCKVKVIVESVPMGTAGALRFSLPFLQPEFILLNGDSWIDVNLSKFISAQKLQTGSLVHMLLREVTDVSRYGLVEVSENTVTNFSEKKENSIEERGHINAGVYVCKRTIVENLPEKVPLSLERDVLPDLVSERKVSAWSASPADYFVDIGLPESYASVPDALNNARRRPAFFLDRDGTLNFDDGYTFKKESLRWIPDAKEAVRLLNENDFFVFVVTNQSGVARGFYQEQDILDFHFAMQSQLQEIGAHLDGLIYCPHHKDGVISEYSLNCHSRKPAPGMLTTMLKNWPIDRENSVVIGDKDTDIVAAKAANIRGVKYDGGSLLNLVNETLKSLGRTCG